MAVAAVSGRGGVADIHRVGMISGTGYVHVVTVASDMTVVTVKGCFQFTPVPKEDPGGRGVDMVAIGARRYRCRVHIVGMAAIGA